MTSKKTHSKISRVKNHLESLTDMGDMTGVARGVRRSIVDDLGKGSANDFMDFLGLGSASSTDKSSTKSESPHGEFKHSGEIVNFEKKAKRIEQRVEAAIDYHRDVLRSSERASKIELQSMNNQVQQIKMELQSLVASSKLLQMEFGKVAMEQPTTEIGVYHTNFFDWVLTMIQEARKKVDDSASWINAAKGKGNKKGYWNMFKKHGTSFGLSSERQVASQVG